MSPTTERRPNLAPGDWTVEPNASRIGFSLRSIPRAKGEFTRIDGTLSVDAKGPIRASATIPVSSLTTGVGMRDWHLRGGHFFAARRFPEIRYETTEVVVDGARVEAKGNLTIKDVTQLLALSGELLPGELPDTVRLQLTGTVNRHYFGVRMMPMDVVMGVPRLVTVELDLTVRRSR